MQQAIEDYSFTLGTHHRVICNYPMEAVSYLITTSYGYLTEGKQSLLHPYEVTFCH